MAEALQAAPPDTQGGAGNDIVPSLLEVADQAGDNPFDVYEYVNSILAGFPPEASVHAVVSTRRRQEIDAELEQLAMDAGRAP